MDITISGPKKIIGMVHVDSLPGCPNNKLKINQIVEKALLEVSVYEKCQVHGICIENMHDLPYLNRNTGHEITACMTRIASEIRRKTTMPCGIQILAGANIQALAVALAADFQFIRAEGFVFSHIADEGFMDSCAGELLRYRKNIGACHVKIFTDIKKKHSSHAITSDIDIYATAKAAEFFMSDGLIITGISTGYPIDTEDARLAKKAVKIPLIAGSGITEHNISDYYALFDAFIVGSWFKTNGDWKYSPDENRIKSFMRKFHEIEQNAGLRQKTE